MYEAFAIGDLEQAVEVAEGRIGRYNIAFCPTPIDDDYSKDFINRWSFLLSEAALGRLKKPSNFPLPDDYFSQ